MMGNHGENRKEAVTYTSSGTTASKTQGEAGSRNGGVYEARSPRQVSVCLQG